MKKHKYIWVYYFFLIMMCLPDNEKYPAILDYAISFSCYTGYLFAITIFIKCKYYLRKELYPLYAWFSWAILATTMNGRIMSIIGILAWSAPLICSAVLANYLIKHDRVNFFERISWIFTALLMIQAFSLYTHCFGTVFTQGHWTNYYFFGIRVGINKITPFAFFFGLLAYQYGRKRSMLSLIISTACGMYFVIAQKVSTSIVGYTIMIAVFIIMKWIKNENFVRYMTILTLFLMASFMFFYSGNNTISNWFFNDVLEEGITLNNRTLIWEQAFDQMEGIHWIIGNGQNSGLTFTLGSRWESGATHNQYLSNLFNYGIIGLSLYILMCIRQVQAVGTKKIIFSTRVFYSVFIAMIIMQIPATVHERPFYYIFYIASLYLQSFENSIGLKQKKKKKKMKKKIENLFGFMRGT